MDGSARQEHERVVAAAHTITVKEWNRNGLPEHIDQEQVG